MTCVFFLKSGLIFKIFYCICMLEDKLFINSGVYISKSKLYCNVKPLAHYFYLNTKIPLNFISASYKDYDCLLLFKGRWPQLIRRLQNKTTIKSWFLTKNKELSSVTFLFLQSIMNKSSKSNE